MKMQRILALCLAVLLVAGLFAGCSAKSDGKGYTSAAGDNMDSDYFSDSVMENASPEIADKAESLTGSAGSQSATPVNQKLIRTLYLDAETENMDTLLKKIEDRVTELDGYIEAQEIYNGSAHNSHRYRYANLTIRIPAADLNGFVSHVGEVSNIISSRQESDDVTLRYVATQSRITALETEQTRLLELLAKAENMNDLLLIESRLTEVRTELEQVTSQLRLYDNLVDYGTIHLNLEEVREYTVVEEPESVWERMGKGFVESLQSLGNGLTELAVFFVVSLPYLVLIAAIVFVIVLIIKLSCKKKKKKVQPPQNPPFPMNPQ